MANNSYILREMNPSTALSAGFSLLSQAPRDYGDILLSIGDEIQEKGAVYQVRSIKHPSFADSIGEIQVQYLRAVPNLN